MLLSSENEIKIADLGISKLMDRSVASTFAGTIIYMSPEMSKSCFEDVEYKPNVDVWYSYYLINHLILTILIFITFPLLKCLGLLDACFTS